MRKVVAFIDGFNNYHSLLENKCSHLKWLNYWKLAELFVKKNSEKLNAVYYFSAIVPWDDAKSARHKTYIQALEISGVTIVLGKFKKVTRTCRECKKIFETFEEKETDVNIAVAMLSNAVSNSFDKALLFTGDSDLIAGVKAVKEVAPHKSIHLVIPYGRYSRDLENNCHYKSRIKMKHLEDSQLQEKIELGKDTGKFIYKPKEWNAPSPSP